MRALTRVLWRYGVRSARCGRAGQASLPALPAAQGHTPLNFLVRRAASAVAAVNPQVDANPPVGDTATLDRRPALQLRPYQLECLEAIRAALDRGVSRIGVSSPTGSGKTTIFGELIEQVAAPSKAKHRVVILVSSIQLAQQTAEHVVRRFPDLWVEIEQGQKHKATGYADVTVATWQTLMSAERAGPGNDMEQLRLEKFDPEGIKAVIVDEAHHAASRSWRLVLNHFNPAVRLEAEASAFETSGSTSKSTTAPPIIGFSATFSRHDGLSLGAVFEEIVFHKDVLDLIDEEFLSPLRFTSIQAQIPLDEVALAGGSAGRDFATTSLARVINTPVVNRLVVRSWLIRTQNRSSAEDTGKTALSHTSFRSRTLVFAVNVQHVHDLTDEFRQAGIDARALTGTTAVQQRRELLSAFALGEFPVLVNCAILTEGADIPSIDCVLLARPTLSRNLFSQMIGRGMRLSPSTGKRDCLILDLVGSCSKGLVCAPTLFGLDPTEPLDDIGTEEMLARRAQKEEYSYAQPPDAETSAGWALPHLSQDPSDIKFIDWDSAEALHNAMRSKALFSGGVERFTSNAWIDCGDDAFVIDVPPNRGFVKAERLTGNEAELYDAELAEQLGGELWVSHFTARLGEDGESPGALRGPRRFRRKGSPFMRPRKIAATETLEQAIHAADTFIATHILRNSGLMRSLMSRFANWRAAPASTKQRAFVEKRLGLAQTGAGPGRGGSAPSSRVAAMTKGEASIILTRLMHGAKSRWQREAKRQNRALEKEQQIADRRKRETVSVGKLE